MPRAVRANFRFDDIERRIVRGARRGMRDLTLHGFAEIRRENPVDTGHSRRRWSWRFMPTRVTGIVGNRVRYIRVVAEGGVIPAHTVRPRHRRALKFHIRGKTVFARRARIPTRTVPSSAKEKRNLGFHIRGAKRAMKQADRLLSNAIRRAGVPIQ